MTAKQEFDNLISQVQMSCLNFRIELSPFSATIFLKKSFVKMHHHGVNIHPSTNPAMEVHLDEPRMRIKEIEIENNSLQEKLRIAARENFTNNEVIGNLRKEIEQKQKIIDGLALANESLSKESKVMGSELYNAKVELTKHFEEANKDIQRNAENKIEIQIKLKT